MKTIFSFILSTILFTSTNAQRMAFTLKDFDLKGKVKSVSEVSYLGVSKFGDLTKGRKISESEEKFNKDGYATEREFIYYDEDGKKDDGFSQSFSFDKNNFLVGMKEEEDDESISHKYTNNQSGQVEVIDSYTKKGKLMARQKIKYNSAGKETEIAQYDANGDLMKKRIFTYSSTGDRRDEKVTDKNGKLIETSYAVYDEGGNAIETGLGKFIQKYKFNQANKKTEERNSVSGFDKKEIFLYDDKGNVVKNVDEYGSVEISTYSYDKNDNWIKRITEIKDVFLGDKVEITEREIKYY